MASAIARRGASRLLTSAVTSSGAAPRSLVASSAALRAFSSATTTTTTTTTSRPSASTLLQLSKRGFASNNANPAMMCFQCEQTSEGKGCTTIGVCGKTPETATMQDLLVHVLKGLSMYVVRARAMGVTVDPEVDRYTLQAMFSTLTNVNFDTARIQDYVMTGVKYRDQIKAAYLEACKQKGIKPESLEGTPAEYRPAGNATTQELEEQGRSVGVLSRRAVYGEDLAGVMEMVTYGIKGLCAYAEHASMLGEESQKVFDFIHRALSSLTRKDITLPEALALALEVGEINLLVMSNLEKGHVEHFGNPTPTSVRRTAVKGRGILVSGHDLKDLEKILQLTEGTGINIYTHGEMLPAHGYPQLRKYKHLVGNYGGAWQMQKFDFAAFPGPVLMTSNCLIEPKKSYKNRIFTTQAVGWPGVTHLKSHDDFHKIVEAAKQSEEIEENEFPERFVSVGFGKNTILGAADKVIDAVKSGAVKHFFFIGGCDGSEGERNYFREVANLAATEPGNVILTAGCGKYRFIDQLSKKDDAENLVTKGIIPKVLDMGQCNDSYGAIQVAVALANAFKIGVNQLPLSFAVSWFEQKAVAVLLTLLHLGVKDIRLGPNLPAFCTPNVLKALVDGYQLKPIDPRHVREEFKAMMAHPSA